MSVPLDLRDLLADLHLALGESLGSGVWRATRAEDGASVVVKMWPVPVGVDPVARIRLQEEAALALADATPHVFERRLVPGHVITVARWEEGTAPAIPMDPAGSAFRALLEAVARLHRHQRTMRVEPAPRKQRPEQVVITRW